jgi:hypothetical protein
LATKKTKAEQAELKKGTLHVEWFPAYGIRIKEMPHLVVIGKTEYEALQHLALLGYHQRRDNHTDYNMVFLNEPFEVD